MTNYTINPGTRPGAIEIAFTAKPDAHTRDALKSLSFRWAPSRGVWYGFSDAATVENALQGCTVSTAPTVSADRRQNTVYIHDGAPCLIYRGILPEVPRDLRERDADGLVELLYSGERAEDYIINIATYYDSIGAEKLLDNIQR